MLINVRGIPSCRKEVLPVVPVLLAVAESAASHTTNQLISLTPNNSTSSISERGSLYCWSCCTNRCCFRCSYCFRYCCTAAERSAARCCFACLVPSQFCVCGAWWIVGSFTLSHNKLCSLWVARVALVVGYLLRLPARTANRKHANSVFSYSVR